METEKLDTKVELEKLNKEIVEISEIINPDKDQAIYIDNLWRKKRRLLSLLKIQHYE